MSPDRKWIWDGAQWRPIAVHEAAFPNWKSLGAGFTPEVAGAGAPLPAAPPASRNQSFPTPAYRLAGPAPDVAAPHWSRKPAGKGLKRFTLAAVGVAALVTLVAVVSVFGTLALSAKPTPPAPQESATPNAGPETRSDSARAAYVVKALDSPVADLVNNAALMRTACRVGMTSSCEDSLISIQNNLASILPALDGATIPPCIAAQTAPLRADLANVSAGDQLALKAYKDGRKTDFSTGLAQVSAASVRVPSNFAGVKKAMAACDGQVTGP
jgi:hypothetical protein